MADAAAPQPSAPARPEMVEGESALVDELRVAIADDPRAKVCRCRLFRFRPCSPLLLALPRHLSAWINAPFLLFLILCCICNMLQEEETFLSETTLLRYVRARDGTMQVDGRTATQGLDNTLLGGFVLILFFSSASCLSKAT